MALFRAKDDKWNQQLDNQLGWGGLAADGLEVHEISGTHVELFTIIGAGVLVEQIEGCLERLAEVRTMAAPPIPMSLEI